MTRSQKPQTPHHTRANPDSFPRFFSKFAASIATLFALALTGCGITGSGPKSGLAAPAGNLTISGHAFGGQQPISGASIQLYAASTSGYGATSTSLIPVPLHTNATGTFTITNDFTCPSGALVYITATGGNPGLSANNNNIAEMAALGPCSNLNSTTQIEINELTTVASVYALSAFMQGLAKIGAPATNSSGIALAFADVNELVNTSTGALAGPALPAETTLPIAKMNTLANILATCINSTGGTAGDSSPCGTLFSAATPPGGTAPTDTVAAVLNIAQNPGSNVAILFGLIAAQQPYGPQLAYAPNDWMLAAIYAPTHLSSPSSIALDAFGNAWITNSAGNSITELDHSGTVLPGSSYNGTFSAPGALALDASGNPWVAQSGNNSLLYLAPSSGSTVAPGTGGLNAPSGVAIDAQGNVWVSNRGASVVTEFNSTGAPITPSGYSGPGIIMPLAIAISSH